MSGPEEDDVRRFVKKKKNSSKYDLVKVKVWVEPDYAQYYVLSRFLLSRMLTVTRVPSVKAVKIALVVKKFLVDQGLDNIPQSALEAILFLTMAQHGYSGEYVQRYRLTSCFFSMRIPLVILLSGAPSSMKSTLAQALADMMNIPNVQQADVMYELLCQGATPPLPPLWERLSLPPQDRMHVYQQECRLVRKAMDGDISKAFKDGKPLIVEGLHVDPGLYLAEAGVLSACAPPADALVSVNSAPVDQLQLQNATKAWRSSNGSPASTSMGSASRVASKNSRGPGSRLRTVAQVAILMSKVRKMVRVLARSATLAQVSGPERLDKINDKFRHRTLDVLVAQGCKRTPNEGKSTQLLVMLRRTPSWPEADPLDPPKRMSMSEPVETSASSGSDSPTLELSEEVMTGMQSWYLAPDEPSAEIASMAPTKLNSQQSMTVPVPPAHDLTPVIETSTLGADSPQTTCGDEKLSGPEKENAEDVSGPKKESDGVVSGPKESAEGKGGKAPNTDASELQPPNFDNVWACVDQLEKSSSTDCSKDVRSVSDWSAPFNREALQQAPAVIIPMVISVDEFDARMLLSASWRKRHRSATSSSTTFEDYFNFCRQADQYICSYSKLGVPVYHAHLGNVSQVIAAMHDHVLGCIQESMATCIAKEGTLTGDGVQALSVL